MGTTDRELLMAVARGSDSAARELWARHAGRLRAFLRSLLAGGGPVDADDVLQQTFCRILETSPATLREVQDVPAWLFQVARHIAFNSGRSERREKTRRKTWFGRGEKSANAGVSPPPPARMLDGSSHDESLSRALGSLMPDMRDVVLLKHVAGLTFDQIAVATQTNRNTAASRYRSALQLLEAALAPPAASVGVSSPGREPGVRFPPVAYVSSSSAVSSRPVPIRSSEVSHG